MPYRNMFIAPAGFPRPAVVKSKNPGERRNVKSVTDIRDTGASSADAPVSPV
ncbi:MAG TPA: hypothetical protein PKJ10_04305 [Smithella sp.]|nr:hypothetical protein [Smithella sp.]